MIESYPDPAVLVQFSGRTDPGSVSGTTDPGSVAEVWFEGVYGTCHFISLHVKEGHQHPSIPLPDSKDHSSYTKIRHVKCTVCTMPILHSVLRRPRAKTEYESL
eukprot:scpid98562/ scgid18337/ 